jgi:hypothetical protein
VSLADGEVVAHWMDMRWLIGWICGGSVDGDEVTLWIEMKWLIGWLCSGTLYGDVGG